MYSLSQLSPHDHLASLLFQVDKGEPKIRECVLQYLVYLQIPLDSTRTLTVTPTWYSINETVTKIKDIYSAFCKVGSYLFLGSMTGGLMRVPLPEMSLTAGRLLMHGTAIDSIVPQTDTTVLVRGGSGETTLMQIDNFEVLITQTESSSNSPFSAVPQYRLLPIPPTGIANNVFSFALLDNGCSVTYTANQVVYSYTDGHVQIAPTAQKVVATCAKKPYQFIAYNNLISVYIRNKNLMQMHTIRMNEAITSLRAHPSYDVLIVTSGMNSITFIEIGSWAILSRLTTTFNGGFKSLHCEGNHCLFENDKSVIDLIFPI